MVRAGREGAGRTQAACKQVVCGPWKEAHPPGMGMTGRRVRRGGASSRRWQSPAAVSIGVVGAWAWAAEAEHRGGWGLQGGHEGEPGQPGHHQPRAARRRRLESH